MLRDVVRRAGLLAAALWLSGCLRPPAAPIVTPRAPTASLADAATVVPAYAPSAPDASRLDPATAVDAGLVRVAGRYLELRAPVRFTPT